MGTLALGVSHPPSSTLRLILLFPNKTAGRVLVGRDQVPLAAPAAPPPPPANCRDKGHALAHHHDDLRRHQRDRLGEAAGTGDDVLILQGEAGSRGHSRGRGRREGDALAALRDAHPDGAGHPVRREEDQEPGEEDCE